MHEGIDHLPLGYSRDGFLIPAMGSWTKEAGHEKKKNYSNHGGVQSHWEAVQSMDCTPPRTERIGLIRYSSSAACLAHLRVLEPELVVVLEPKHMATNDTPASSASNVAPMQVVSNVPWSPPPRNN